MKLIMFSLFFLAPAVTWSMPDCDCKPPISDDCWMKCWTQLLSEANSDQLKEVIGLQDNVADKITLYKWRNSSENGAEPVVSETELKEMLTNAEYADLKETLQEIKAHKFTEIKREISGENEVRTAE